jgi:hypothetical protein
MKRRCYGCGQAYPCLQTIISVWAFRRDAHPRVWKYGKAGKKYYCDACVRLFQEELEVLMDTYYLERV